MAKKSSMKAKYNREVEEIRRLHDLNRLLKAGDLQNALLSSSSSDSEIMNEAVVDSLLEQADREAKAGSRGLDIITKLTAVSPSGSKVIRESKTRVRSKRVQIKMGSKRKKASKHRK